MFSCAKHGGFIGATDNDCPVCAGIRKTAGRRYDPERAANVERALRRRPTSGPFEDEEAS